MTSALLIALALPCAAYAKVADEQAAELGQRLTPVGAEAAGNAAGTIPAWQPLRQETMKRGDNPYAQDKPLYTVTAANVAQYRDRLTEGHQQLFKIFPDYTMPVYPSHRSASYPDWFIEATKKNAQRVELTHNGYGFCCTAQGFPFPIPKNGTEVLWNHIMRYNTRGFRGYTNSAEIATNGAYVVERSYSELAYAYNDPKTTAEKLGNQNLYLFTKVVAPATRAGDATLLRVPLDRIKDLTGVWIWTENRPRRIGEVGYDNPLHDGLMTHDQVDMFNGPLDRYTIKLLGKREMLVPYDSYRLYDDKLKYKDIIRAGHINQDLARYELHRVWVLEAQVKQGTSHVYKRRVFYVDEDSWIVVAEDMYDQRDQFWRSAESHSINFANVPVMVNGIQVHYDLQSRRYVILNMTNEEKNTIEYDWSEGQGYFSPGNLKRFAGSTNGR
ncbi:DUF1329 domain-containing protein [Hydrocarboniphaga sp.]|uniref:DUF1329 domain-containing protein n=1 Tax=Hydrocarboniphaga sp. TaxID=2033016 RepID=UPI003D0C4794